MSQPYEISYDRETQPRTFEREIVWSHEDRDFAMYLNGELVGFARNYADAERTLDELVYSILTRQSETA